MTRHLRSLYIDKEKSKISKNIGEAKFEHYGNAKSTVSQSKFSFYETNLSTKYYHGYKSERSAFSRNRRIPF